MDATLEAPIWVDDADPIFRRGMIACLDAEGFTTAGESAALRPEPDLSKTAVLLFEVNGGSLPRATRLAQRYRVRLVGLVPEGRQEDLYDTLTSGLAGVLVRSELTPSRLTTCVRAVNEGNGSIPRHLLGQMLAGLAKGGPRGASTGQLARREVNVLRRLAEGDSTRDIAKRLSYSERTVKNIVHDLLVKLNCRTRAHAVALGTRHGVI
ncbi:MAG: LuxR C-terminal-related transcriptional regulator [Gaiellaceae bacterium]